MKNMCAISSRLRSYDFIIFQYYQKSRVSTLMNKRNAMPKELKELSRCHYQRFFAKQMNEYLSTYVDVTIIGWSNTYEYVQLPHKHQITV